MMSRRGFLSASTMSAVTVAAVSGRAQRGCQRRNRREGDHRDESAANIRVGETLGVDRSAGVSAQQAPPRTVLDHLHTPLGLLWLDGDAGQMIAVPAGHFMLLWPGDAHMPGLEDDRAGDVLKVVVKIAV